MIPNNQFSWNKGVYHTSALLAKVTEPTARIPNQTYSYTGTVRTVGSGKTHATLTAAYAACVSGDIIEVYGTIDLNSEASNYWLINTAKNVLVRGSTPTASDTVLNQGTALTYAVRVRVNSGIVFSNLTIQTDKDVPLIFCDGDEANRNIICDNVRFIQNGSGASSRFTEISNALTSTTTRWFEYKDCVFIKNGADTNVGVNLADNSSNSTHLYTNCTFTLTTNPGFLCSDVMIGTLAMYDCTFSQSASYVIIRIGQDTGIPTSTVGLFDFRSNVLSFTPGFRQHGLLIGRGTDLVKCYNNEVYMDSFNDSLAIGIIVKSTSGTIGNAVYTGNFCVAARPFYIKGGSKANIVHNIYISNNINWSNFDFSNHKNGADEVLSRYNVITNNVFLGEYNSIYVYNTGCSESDEVSLKTCTLDYNKYYAPLYNYLYNTIDTTQYLFGDRNVFWASSNEVNSVQLNNYSYP